MLSSSRALLTGPRQSTRNLRGDAGSAGEASAPATSQKKQKRKKLRAASSAPGRAAGSKAAAAAAAAANPQIRRAKSAREAEDEEIGRVWSAAKRRVAKYVTRHGELPTAIKAKEARTPPRVAAATRSKGGSHSQRARAKPSATSDPAAASNQGKSSKQASSARARIVTTRSETLTEGATSGNGMPSERPAKLEATGAAAPSAPPVAAGDFLARLGEAERRDSKKLSA